MNARDWTYVSEGGKHALFASSRREEEGRELPTTGRLLRIDKEDLARALCCAEKNQRSRLDGDEIGSISTAKAAAAEEEATPQTPLWFLRHIVKPHLSHYFDLPESVSLTWSFLCCLATSTLQTTPCPIPESRKTDWVLPPDDNKQRLPEHATGWLVWDHRKITRFQGEMKSNDVGPCLSAEIKPKAGYWASSPLVHPERTVKYLEPRFVLLQELDRLGHSDRVSRGWKPQGEEETNQYQSNMKISRYNPLDLFCLDPDRIRQALKSLWVCPQNNFKLWYTLSTSGISEEELSIHTPRLLVADEHYLDSNGNRSGNSPPDWRSALRDFFAPFFVEDHYGGPDVLRDKFCELLTDVLQAERTFLDRILQWQHLDVLDADGAVAIYSRLVELCNGSHSEAQRLVDQSYRENNGSSQSTTIIGGFLHASPFSAPTEQCPAFSALCADLDRFSNTFRTLPKQGRLEFLQQGHEKYRHSCLHFIHRIQSKEACCYLLQNWLLSLAMCDVSFFVTVQPFRDTSLSAESDLAGDAQAAASSTILKQQTDAHPGVIQLYHTKECQCPFENSPTLCTAKGCTEVQTMRFQYEIKLIDCDQKPAQKLQFREKREEVFKILQCGN